MAHRPLPTWYYRVARLEYTKGRDPYPEEFDEDLSELEELEESDEKECECDDDTSECECDLEDDDKESERSYDGSDADYYYELKEARKERKRELLEQRERHKEEKKARIEYEKEKEEEVNAAYESFKQVRRRAKKESRTITLAGQTFNLFSSEFAELRNPHFLDGTKYVQFYHVDDQGAVGFSQNAGKQVDPEERPVDGHVYFDGGTGCSFGPLPLPTQARRKDVKIKGDGKYDLLFDFFGNGYLKLRVPRDLLKDTLVSSSTAPQIFEFVGILRDYEKERKERAEARERAARNRPPSPRESYFEMNHFMGSWAESRR